MPGSVCPTRPRARFDPVCRRPVSWIGIIFARACLGHFGYFRQVSRTRPATAKTHDRSTTGPLGSHIPTEATVGKRTFQPNNRHRAKTDGFRLRMRTRAGRAILSARRGKGRAKISA